MFGCGQLPLLVCLDYLGGFLHSKALIKSPLKNYFTKKLSPVQVTLNITRWNPLTWPVNTCSDSGHNMNFLLSNSSSKKATSKNSIKKIKPLTITQRFKKKIRAGLHNYRIDLCSQLTPGYGHLQFKASFISGTIKLY